MKKFSLPLYYIKFFFYLLVSFFLHMLIMMLFSLLTNNSEYAGLIGLGLGFQTYPWGFWNILFFAFALPLDRASKPSVWLGSILGLPLLILILLTGSYGFSNIANVLTSGFWLGSILSNAVFYAIGYSAAKFRHRKQMEKEAEKESKLIDSKDDFSD